MSFAAIRLRAVLPLIGNTTASLEDQSRTVLHLLLDRIDDVEPYQEVVGGYDRCPNCDALVASPSSPYCSEMCRDQAAFIRQFRAAIVTGTILSPEKQVVFGERLWWLLGGGLPIRDSNIPESAKRQVVKRSEGKCETCGAPLTRVENIGSGCNRPLHLRAVCAGCSQTKRFGDIDFGQSPAVINLLTNFAKRIVSDRPIRPCDDSENWDWRAFLANRRLLGT